MAKFVKGQSGNPGGKNKTAPGVEKLFKTALIMELKTKGARMPELRMIARKAIDLALDGDSSARATIIERLDGKLPQPMSGPDGEGAVTVIIEHITSSA